MESAAPRVLETVPAGPDPDTALDVAVGLIGASLLVAAGAVRSVTGSQLLRARALWRPALVPYRLQPATLVDNLARTGARHRVVATRQAQALLDQWTPVLLEQVLTRVDLTELVLRHLDVDRVVATADLDAAVARVDLVGLVEEVIAAVDLPAIIRDSTGSMASETVRGARMAGINVDEAINRTLERHLFRRRRAPAAESD